MPNESADWSGYVPPPNCRKYIPQQKESYLQENSNWRPKLKVFNDKHKDSSENFQGPVLEDNGSFAWQTEAQSASIQTKTTQSQLTEGGRSMFVRGKQSTIPAYELAKPYSESVGARLRQENPYNLHDSNDVSESEANKFGQAKGKEENNENVDENYALIGYRARTSKSFLGGLGAEVARAMLGDDKD